MYFYMYVYIRTNIHTLETYMETGNEFGRAAFEFQNNFRLARKFYFSVTALKRFFKNKDNLMFFISA